MPPRTKTVVLDVEPGEALEIPSAEERHAAEIAQQMTAYGLEPRDEEYFGPPPELQQKQDAYISVFRIDRDTKRRVYCCQYAPAEFNLERLRRDKGGGYYWVRLIARNPNNKNRPSAFWQDFVELEGEPITGAPTSEREEHLPAIPVRDNGDVLAAIQALSAGMMQGLRELATALAPRQESRADILAEMAQMKALFGGEQRDPLAIMTQTLQLVKENMPRDGETSMADVFMGLVDRFGPVLAQAAAQQQPAAMVPARLPQRQIAPAPMPTAAAPVAPTAAAPVAPTAAAPVAPVESPEDTMALGMRAALRVLTTAAKAGAEPASYAEMVLDMLPSEQWGVLADSPTDVVLEYLAQFGDVQPHRDWFGRLHDEIKNLLTPEPDTGTTASETPGAVDTDG